MDNQLNRTKIVESLMQFGDIEVCSIGDHFALLIKGNKDINLESFKTVMEINNILKEQGVTNIYPHVQVAKNEKDYFVLTLNK